METFECHNPHCPLNRPDQPGRFTGGVTAAYLHILTGDPIPSEVEPAEVKLGYCPSCGEEGTPAEDQHVTHDCVGDPFQPLHDQVAEMVTSPDDPTTPEVSQAIVLAFIAQTKENAENG